MPDVMTEVQRSKTMTAVKSKYNKTTELALIKVLRKWNIKGWRRHLANIEGKPDFAFLEKRKVIFVDGCFWHGCKRCGTLPKTNRKFWKDKIERNISRDKAVTKILKKEGWNVIRIWEHQLKRGLSDDIILKIS